jgi:hypothetical protein
MQVTLDTTLVLCRHRTERGSAGSTATNTPEKFTLTRRYRARFCAFLWLKLDDAAAHTNSDGLGTIGRAELFHDVFDVNFHCLL